MEKEAIDRLQELVQDSGMSVSKFSEKAEINQSNFSAILRRKRNLGGNVLVKIAEAFEVNTKWIARGEGEKYKHEKAESQNALLEYSSSNIIDYKEKYIEELEDQLKLLKEMNQYLQKDLNEKSDIIKGFLDGNIEKVGKTNYNIQATK